VADAILSRNTEPKSAFGGRPGRQRGTI